jgi:hypothetical protein
VKATTYNSETDFLDEIVNSTYTYRNVKIMVNNIRWVNCFTPSLDAELSYKWNYNSENLRVNTNIYVDVLGLPGATGIVTLTGPEIQPMIQPVVIGETGPTRVTFIVFANGEYTALIEVGSLTVEKKITA